MFQDLIKVKTAPVRFGHDVIHEFAQLPRAIAPVGDFVRPRRDKSAYASPRFDDPFAFEFGIDLRHRVRVNTQVNGQLPYGGQLIADGQLTGDNRKTN